MRFTARVALIAGTVLVGSCDQPTAPPVERPHLSHSRSTIVTRDIAAGVVEVTAFGITDNYSFIAVREPGGPVQGQWFLMRTNPDGTIQRASGTVTCLTIVGNTARLTGVATGGDASLVEGPNNRAVWTVQDNGQGSTPPRDLSTLFFVGQPPQSEVLHCADGFGFGLFPITSGDIVVQSGIVLSDDDDDDDSDDDDSDDDDDDEGDGD